MSDSGACCEWLEVIVEYEKRERQRMANLYLIESARIGYHMSLCIHSWINRLQCDGKAEDDSIFVEAPISCIQTATPIL